MRGEEREGRRCVHYVMLLDVLHSCVLCQIELFICPGGGTTRGGATDHCISKCKLCKGKGMVAWVHVVLT